MREAEIKVKSLAKAMRVLECFSMAQPELGVTEIAQMLGLHKSTVHNIASTFEQMGYLAQNPETGKYYLGVKLLQFSYIINNHMGLQKFFFALHETHRPRDEHDRLPGHPSRGGGALHRVHVPG